MKVCFFISSISQAGGTGRVCTETANKLAENGHQVSILSMYGGEPFFTLNSSIEVVNCYSHKYNFLLFLPLVISRLRLRFRRLSPDVVISVDSALFVYALAAGVGYKFKNIVWEHFNFNVSLNARIRVISRRLAAKYSSAIVTLTQKDKGYWESNLKVKVPVVAIPNPAPALVKPSDLPQRKNIVLSVGRLTYQKGFDRLINIWHQLSKDDRQGWELLIVGSGELAADLKQQVSDCGLTVSVRFISNTTAISNYYNMASIYCMTSRFEGFPMVLLEAQAYGLPVISYDCETGPSEIIDPSNGILVTNGDEQQMANALKELMKDHVKRVQMGLAARHNAAQFDINRIIQDWESLLKEVF